MEAGKSSKQTGKKTTKKSRKVIAEINRSSGDCVGIDGWRS